MNLKKIIIYQQKVLFNILDELEDKLNLDFVEADHTNFSYILKNINTDFLVISNSKKNNFKNHLIIEENPIKLEKLLELINIALLREKFSYQSDIAIGKYKLNLNSKEISKNNIIIKDNYIKYKTISLIINKKEYHITSSRKDLISYGRSALVDIAASLNDDVKRRDFTINSLYLDSQGNLTDFLNGENDLIKRKLVFIGNPVERIEEDYLRILRFCRFSGNFDNKISKNLKKEITSRVPKIINLSNKRIRDEIDKILLTKNCYKCFLMMTKLTLDKYLLINKNNYRRSEISSGFVLKNFGIIEFIKSNAKTVIQNEKLDLISVIMIHLYGGSNVEMIINRFDLNKRKTKFLYFVRQLINLKINIKNNFLGIIKCREKKNKTSSINLET